MIQKMGNNSMLFEKPPVILAASSVVGEKEGQGPLGQYFDHVEKDPKFGMETWEQAESTMQLMAAEKVIKKAGLSKEQLDFLFAGDLLGQLIATSFGLMELERPVFGVYGACSTIGESLLLASMRKSKKNLEGGVTRSGLYVILSNFLGDVADHIKKERPLDAAKLRTSSTHWLRHTFAVTSLEVMPVNVVQTALGHASVGTTSKYIIPDEQTIVEALKKKPDL